MSLSKDLWRSDILTHRPCVLKQSSLSKLYMDAKARLQKNDEKK